MSQDAESTREYIRQRVEEGEWCEGCLRHSSGLCYECQCEAHARGEYDMDATLDFGELRNVW